MSLEIGPLTAYQSSAVMRPTPPRPSSDPLTPAAPVRDTAELSLPALPPPEVLDEIGAAADRVDELHAANRELHFRKDADSGRVIVEVRDLEGNVIRTIPPSEAIGVLSGAAL